MLGARITLMRKARNMSQTELAERVKISPSAVGMYEQGRRQPSVDILAEIAAALGVSIDYLVTGRPTSELEEQALNDLLADRLAVTDKRLDGRAARPFSRQELAVLMAAMLMEP